MQIPKQTSPGTDSGLAPAFFTRFWLSGAFITALLWLVGNTWIMTRFALPGSDSVMYALPVAVGAKAFHLGIPFLGDFSGYGTHWGHHWPGVMLLKSVFFSVAPYSRALDIGVHLVGLLAVASLSGLVVWELTRKRILVLATAVLICSDRIALTGIASHRIEILGILALTVLIAFSVVPRLWQSRGWAWLAAISALVAPTAHPYALLFAGIVILFNLIQAWFREPTDKKTALLLVGVYSLGILFVVGWFLLQPAVLEQFTTNLKLQKSFYKNYSSVILALSNYRYGTGYLIWTWAGIGSLLTLVLPAKIRAGTGDAYRALLLLFLVFTAVAAFHTITRCENFFYLAFAAPVAAMAISLTVALVKLPRPLALVPSAAFCGLTLLAFTIFPYRVYQYAHAGFPDLNARLAGTIADLPRGVTVYIPPAFWAVACNDHTRTYKFYTFCVASKAEVRRRYETEAYRSAQQGDFLVVENPIGSDPDKFGTQPTFPIHPPDEKFWEFTRRDRQLYPGKTPWGIDFSFYRFRGGTWPVPVGAR